MIRRLRQAMVFAVSIACVAACGNVIVSVPVVPAASIPTSNSSTFDAAASPVAPFTIPGVRACEPSDLAVSLDAVDPSDDGGGAPNTSSWLFDVRDIGSRPCFVGPTPDVSFYSTTGLVALPKDMQWPGNIVYLAPALDPAPPYFSSATGSLYVQGCYLKSIDHVRIDLGTPLGSVTVPPGPDIGHGTPCPVPGAFYSSELYGGGNNENTGGWAPLTQTTIQAPSSAKPGERLQFQVTLENVPAPRLGNGTPQSAILSLKHCPSFYDEIEGVVGTFHTSLLDCAKAKAIPPGGSETFDMIMDIPAAAQPGPATLIWSIIGSPEYYEEGTSYLPIT